MPTQWPRFDPGGLDQFSLVKESKSSANHHHSNVIYMLMHQPAVMQGPWSGIAMKGFEPATCYKKGGRLSTSEFPGQLIALLLAAQWLERWCVN